MHNPKPYGNILSKSPKDNFDIDTTFPDRHSWKIFIFYYNHDNDNMQTDISDMEDNPYMDDNDFRRSSLNLSDPRTILQAQPQWEAEKRQVTSDEFQLSSTPARGGKHDEKTRPDSV